MARLKVTLLLIFIFFAGIQNHAREKNCCKTCEDPVNLGVRMHYGWIIQHSRWVKSAAESYPRGLELNLSWRYNNQDVWNNCGCYPRFGIYGMIWDYTKPGILGYGFATGLDFTYYFVLPGKFNPFVRGGAGFAYLTKPYDKENNRDNMSYAMHFNFNLFVNFGFLYQFNDDYGVNFSINMNHQSNAGIKEPNGGINFPSFSLGVQYSFEKGEFPHERKRDPEYFEKAEKVQNEIVLYGGLSAISFPDSGQFPMVGIQYLRHNRVSPLHSFLYGIELEMNGRGRSKNARYHGGRYDYHRVSVIVGHEFVMGNTQFSTSLGFYVYRPLVESDFMYQRYGLMYRFNKRFSAGLNFKSYGHVADFFDLRVSWSF